MLHSLHLPFPTFPPRISVKKNTKNWGFHLLICFCHETHENGGYKNQDRLPRTLLIERYDNGTTKRYILDKQAQLQTVLEEDTSMLIGSQGNQYAGLSWIPVKFRNFILPAGFPESVSDDYLEYMLLQFPTNVTAWVCQTLVSSSLLKAVGLSSFSGTTAAASAVAIRWVSKDGLGAIGRLFIGGQFGGLFDDDPKQWRLYADFIGSAGSIFELCTQIYPAYFLPLASLGNLAKAVARGLKDPSFRVIQNHFATSGNVGDVSAKEEVWEVAAQLVGLALGILLLATPELLTSYPLVVFIWTSIRLLHLWLRYQSLSVLRFSTINLKRARMLAESYVLCSTVPSCADCNKEENILSVERLLKPRISFGVSLEKMINRESSNYTVEALVNLYKREKYILAVNPDSYTRQVEVFVLFKAGATSMSVFRSIWQTYWLHRHWRRAEYVLLQLEESLSKLEDSFEDFLQQLEGKGWDIKQMSLRVPKGLVIEEICRTESTLGQ